jgi:hypothetical protein
VSRQSSLRLLCAVLLALAAQRGWAAPKLEGAGRVTLLGGWRLTPNDYFANTAAAAGFPLEKPSAGGPMATGTFAYGATENIEVGIDLFGGGETLKLQGLEPYTSISYGALVGARFQTALFDGALVPHVGLLLGPLLALVSTPSVQPQEERLVTAYAGLIGASLRFGDRFGATLEYKYILARGIAPGIGGINAGGHWLGIGVTYYVASDPNESSPGDRRTR